MKSRRTCQSAEAQCESGLEDYFASADPNSEWQLAHDYDDGLAWDDPDRAPLQHESSGFGATLGAFATQGTWGWACAQMVGGAKVASDSSNNAPIEISDYLLRWSETGVELAPHLEMVIATDWRVVD